MIKKLLRYQFLIFLVFVVPSCSAENVHFKCDDNDEFVTYKPVTMNLMARSEQDVYLVDSSPISKEQFNNLKFVLNKYREEYKIDKNNILISCKLAKNLDLLANYTKKANSKKWLKDHRK